MASDRSKSLQEKFGFFDEALKTPAHDVLMFWIDEHIEEVLAEVFRADKSLRVFSKTWEMPIKDERGYLLGVADMAVQAFIEDHIAVMIEAKPKIDSLGELIRQIRIYQFGGAFDRRPKWLVISPEERFAVKLREQGILFHKSPMLQSNR
jgi:hypothetical protein